MSLILDGWSTYRFAYLPQGWKRCNVDGPAPSIFYGSYRQIIKAVSPDLQLKQWKDTSSLLVPLMQAMGLKGVGVVGLPPKTTEQ